MLLVLARDVRRDIVRHEPIEYHDAVRQCRCLSHAA
jgi:hypothetical protein